MALIDSTRAQPGPTLQTHAHHTTHQSGHEQLAERDGIQALAASPTRSEEIDRSRRKDLQAPPCLAMAEMAARWWQRSSGIDAGRRSHDVSAPRGRLSHDLAQKASGIWVRMRLRHRQEDLRRSRHGARVAQYGPPSAR